MITLSSKRKMGFENALAAHVIELDMKGCDAEEERELKSIPAW